MTAPRLGWSRALARCTVLWWILAPPVAAQAHPARIAIILDSDSPRFRPLVDAFQAEVLGFFRPGELVLLPPMSGDGTGSGVGRVLDRVLKDSSVSVIVTLGSISSHLLARSGPPPKPAIAGVVIDASWQGIPQQDGASGIRGLTYVDESFSVGSTLIDFHRLIPFRKLAALIDKDVLKDIPQLRANATALVRSAGAEEVAIIPSGSTAAEVLAALPAGTDAVYLTPLPAMGDEELTHLLAGLNARRLPTLSYLADPDVRLGALASYEPPENWLRRARRVAVDLQRILAGEDAGTLPVRLVSASRLTLNLATARQIGFSPGWSLLTDADLVGADSVGPSDTLTLAGTMRSAAEVNLDLAAQELQVASGTQNVRLARSNLLPQIEGQIGETYTREGTAAASLGQQPENLTDGGVTFSLPLYSEQAWAGYSSERRLQRGREAERDQLRLDVVLDAAEAYLSVLEAQKVSDVRKSDLYRTRSNLEVARLREGIGSASRADIYRWQGEVANARRDLISSETQVRVALLELKRILNRPLDRPVAQRPVTLGDPALLAQDSTILGWFDDPARLATLAQFLVSEAFRISPELTQADAAIAAQQRQRTAAGRAFWLPSFSLQGGFNNVFQRGGEGSSAPVLPVPTAFPTAPDLSWQFRVQASLPLFTGFGRTANRAQTDIDLERLRVQRQSIRLAVDQRVRAALESAASTYAAIALTRDASEAANRNYELVSDAYARGTASITALIDAQSAAENSSESAANAIHDFLLDLLRVERAMGDFTTLRPAEQRQAFLERLRALKEKP
ncbi:MAG TPA: TolC family protein [Gemmatimonadales bacterium]